MKTNVALALAAAGTVALAEAADLVVVVEAGRVVEVGPLAELLIEVGHHADGVRQPRALVERRAALVVDEHERDRIRWVRHGEPGDERAEQL